MRALQLMGGRPTVQAFDLFASKQAARAFQLFAGEETVQAFRLFASKQAARAFQLFTGEETVQAFRLFAGKPTLWAFRLLGGKQNLQAIPVGCLVVVLSLAYPIAPHEPLLVHEGVAAADALASDEATVDGYLAFDDFAADVTAPKQDLSYLADYVYSEVPPDEKPADTVRNLLKDVPLGTPIEEIKRVCDLLGLDFGFMKAVAKIESDFDPKQKTGSYIGLYQLSNYEFDRYGSGDITNPRDNAIAAAFKFATAAALFEIDTHKRATRSDLYLIHQQGTQGAAEHVSHPERIAWKSMCATDEGRLKGEKWCKRAIWQNTLPAIKEVWKSVDNLTSAAFVSMWEQRVATLYARYADTDVDKAKTAAAATTAATGAP
jgi:hypothetical protein